MSQHEHLGAIFKLWKAEPECKHFQANDTTCKCHNGRNLDVTNCRRSFYRRSKSHAPSYSLNDLACHNLHRIMRPSADEKENIKSDNGLQKTESCHAQWDLTVYAVLSFWKQRNRRKYFCKNCSRRQFTMIKSPKKLETKRSTKGRQYLTGWHSNQLAARRRTLHSRGSLSVKTPHAINVG